MNAKEIMTESPEINLPDDKAVGLTRARASRGGLYIGVGFFLTLLTSTAATPPGGYWPLLVPAFLFAFFGFWKSKGRARRIAGIVVSGASGGWMVADFLTFLSER